MATATYKEWINTANWDQVVKILQAEFRYIRLPTECMCQTVVLIRKGNWWFIGIGIVEVLWKVLLGVINGRIGVEVYFHDVLHGFWVGR